LCANGGASMKTNRSIIAWLAGATAFVAGGQAAYAGCTVSNATSPIAARPPSWSRPAWGIHP
jgi:hypothetical protein